MVVTLYKNIRASRLIVVVILLVTTIILLVEGCLPITNQVRKASNTEQIGLEVLKECERLYGVGPLVGDIAIDFELQDINGAKFVLSKALAIKPVVIVFGSIT